MKNIMTFVLILGLCLAVNGTATATQIWDQPGYRPSTNLVLGALGTDDSGTPGFVIAQEFQLNLLYQAGILNSDIDAINNYCPSSWPEGALNFHDSNDYVLRFDLNGGLPVYQYSQPYGTLQSDSGSPDIQWTLTGWGQTILAGNILDQGNGRYFFQLLPYGTYRPFPNDPPVNEVEVFSGNVLCEPLGYYFNGSLTSLSQGSTLEVHNTPIPGSLLLLGSGLAGLAVWRRRRNSNPKS